MQSREPQTTGGDDAGKRGRAGDREPAPPFGDLVLRTPPNWTAVGFLGLLALAHLGIAAVSFVSGRWEGYLSLLLGTASALAAAAAVRFRFELAVLPSCRRLRLRHGVGRFHVERLVPFSAVRGVRLTIVGAGRRQGREESLIELLCPGDNVECPPTRIPRQEALYLAMALGVPLIKVSDDGDAGKTAGAPQQADEVSSRRGPCG